MAQQDAEADEGESENDSSRTTVEQNGRYDEIEIEGVESGSLTIDYGKTPPEVMVDATDSRTIHEDYPEAPSHIHELPDDSDGDREAIEQEIEAERKLRQEHNV